ncbi:MAG: RNA 2',3'-cyclic phosphodiesterase [Firmicutes bacterium]|nr:RNA 2',3'-cyclic phosphodiesterase [Bacillota bacterium]
MSRIFFALTLPEEIKTSLLALRKGLTIKPNAVKWVEKENLHLTLHFVGDVDNARIPQLLQKAAAAAAGTAKFTVSVEGVGVFPSLYRPRVVWAGIKKGQAEVIALAQALKQTLGSAQKQPLSPHITIGRIRSGKQLAIEPFLQREAQFYAGTFEVSSFTCFTSTLTRHGPIYRIIKEILLS